ncbi:Lipid phosphate phosphatase 1 [Cyphellophora attinorum]|uniref:Lipid phosphate phosphatase 1 n=1 Tax=Cyphellophora attinorum TaxID=1664694 RepID=A0A0N0NN62_9EURO|nr:Lipid phosphate phosphatase 1 [Phialophora attinorum]KPI41251.1 Lipid phosphate phosphatase 1 [Phialophora attinorum]
MGIFSRRRDYDDYDDQYRHSQNHGTGLSNVNNNQGFGPGSGHHHDQGFNSNAPGAEHNTGFGTGHNTTGPFHGDTNTHHDQNTINPLNNSTSGTTVGHHNNTGLNNPNTNIYNNNYPNDHYDDRHSRHRSQRRGRRSGGGFLRRRSRSRSYDRDYDRGYNSHTEGRNSGYGSSLSKGRHNRDYDHHQNSRMSNRRSRSRKQRQMFDMESGAFNHRPKFGQWLKFIWLDLLTMAIMGAIGLGVYFADPAPSRSFPVTFARGSQDVVYPEVAYPLRNEIVPIYAAALLASLIPILIILLMQIRVKSFWDVNNAILGLLYSLIAAAVFQVFLKWLVGGLRPHFLAVCNPDPSQLLANGNGYQGIMFDRRICRGSRKAVNDALESFPSGHSTAAFAGFIYLYFYLNAKLKVFANYHPHFWKLIVTYAPVLGAVLIAGSMTISEYHHWYDVVAGGIIGTVMAASAYRMVYASIWDFRFNHIPMTRHTPFSFGAGAAGAGGFETAVFTRRAGWGTEEAFGGAPFDAAYHLRGQVNGFNTGVHNHSEKGDHTGIGGHHHNSDKHGLGHHNNVDDGNYRRDDIEHHAGTTGGTTGGPLTGNNTAGATGNTTALDHNAGVHRDTTIDQPRRTLDPSNQSGYRSSHDGHRSDHSLGRGAGNNNVNRDGMIDMNNQNDSYNSGNVSDGSNRYRQHRGSTERRAVVAGGPGGSAPSQAL